MNLIDEVGHLAPGTIIAIDTETTGLRPFNGDVLRGISVAFRRSSGDLVSEYWPLSHPNSVNVSSAAVARAINWAHRHCLCVYHNGKFDAKFLAQVGVEWPERFYDTKVVSFLLDENENHSLKPTAARIWPDEDAAGEQRHLKELMGSETKGACYKRLRYELGQENLRRMERGETPIKESAHDTRVRVETERIMGKTWATLTYDDIQEYAAKDAELTLRLHEWQTSQAEYARVLPAVEPYLRFEALMHRMECAGVAIDRGYVDQLVAECEDEIEGIRTQFPGVSLDSTPQLQKLIYGDWGLTPLGFTGKGAPSTSREALELLEGAHPDLDKILRYRKAKKLVSGFLSQLLKEVGADGRVHPSFNASSRSKGGSQAESDTVTGRLTCSGPNLQQRPRDLPAGVFVAPDGYELWSYDMSQAELRIAASIAEEPAMIDVFLTGGDIYLATAEELGITRQSSKTVRLSSVYGIGARKLCRKLLEGTGKQPTECLFWLTDPEERYKLKLRKCRKCDACAARELLDNYWASVPHLDIVNRNLVAYAEAAREVPLHVEGRYRRYPQPWECAERKLSAPWPRPYTALNSVIQGGCAELLKGWLLAAEPRVNALGARIICTIHDSVTCEVPAGRGLEVGAVLQEALDSVTPEGWVQVPLDPKEGI